MLGLTPARIVLLSTASLVSLSPALAHAQTAPVEQPAAPPPSAGPIDAQAAGENEGTQEIVVTGTRTGVSGYDAPTPTTIVGADLLDQRQATNVADVLQTLPAFKASSSPAANGIRSQLPGVNQADLRSLGSNRTLVLVDGMRVVPQAPASNTGTGVSPDLNQIPALMVERIDVVTGGASAQWGSDAVGGVVNVVLRKRYDGLRVTGQAGISERGDAEQFRIGAIGGLNLLDDRLHIVASADWTKNKEVGDLYTRDWGREEYQIVTNSQSATNGLPVNLIVPQARFYSSPDLLITNSTNPALRNRTFTGGQLVPFNTGSLVGGAATIGGQGFSQALGVSLVPGVERFDSYLRAQYDVSDSTNVYLVASYAQLNSELSPLPSRITGGTIRSDNAFLRQFYPQVAASLGATGTITFNRANYDFDPNNERAVRIENKTPHLAAGIEGSLGASWDWDAHVGWGRNEYTNSAEGIGIRQRITYATDAVLYNGAITCRALVPGSTTFNPTAAAGCVPLNLFGAGSPSAEAIGYAAGNSISQADYTQVTAAANLRGRPFSTWAGEASIALGVEYRREREVVTGSPIAAANGFELANVGEFSGSFNVKEGYLEALVPLLDQSPLGHALNVNGAVRVADYSSVGTKTTWKAGATYEPVEGLLLRGNISSDIRAPALFELFSPGSIATNTVAVRNPANGVTYSVNIPVNISRGNTDLDAEDARTYTAGVAWSPGFAPGLNLSFDYYKIRLNNAITSLSSTAAASFCNAGNAFYCSVFTFSPAGPPTGLDLGVQNLQSVEIEGLDGSLDYRLPLQDIAASLPGTLRFNIAGTYTFNALVDTGLGITVDRAGENSSLNTYSSPDRRLNASISYSSDGGFTGTVLVNHVSAGTIDNTFNTSPATSANRNRVPGYATVALYLNQEITDRVELFASVRNLFDKDPPVVPNPQLYQGTNAVYYDTIGRYFTAGFRFDF